MIECKRCRAQVIPVKKKFNLLLFLALLIIPPLALIYVIIHLTRQPIYCPNCKSKIYQQNTKAVLIKASKGINFILIVMLLLWLISLM